MNLARALWQYGEPIHAITYYSDERRAATDALGMKGGWMSYFACRAAPLGAIDAPALTAILYVFHPRMVTRAVPDAWGYAPPGRVLDARLTAMDAAMRRVLGDAVVASPAMRQAADLAAAVVAGCEMAGRPLGAANQAVPVPDEPHLRLWQALTAIREHRGDGHVHRLVEAEISPAEALVLQSATGRSPEDGLRVHRGWTDEEWDEASAALARRVLVDRDGRITAAGAALRQEVEEGTDRLAAPVVASIGNDRAAELVELLRPMAKAVMTAEAVPAHNNMGFPWPPEED